MSARLLQKQVGAAPSEASAEAKAAVRPAGRGVGGRDEGNRGYYSGGGGSTYSGGGGYYSDAGAGGASSSSARPPPSAKAAAPAAFGGRYGGGGAATVASPGVGRFSGSDAQRAHVEAMRQSTKEAGPTAASCQEVSVKSHLGLNALKERKKKEEEEKEAKREAARAKRHAEATKKEADDEKALEECEAQAWQDSEGMERVRYEAALVVRIACRFGTAGVWTKLAEARARGADIPLDPRRIFVLAHPDKCPMPEASDATAILNAQRPPEMTEARPRPAAKAAAAGMPKPSPRPKEEERRVDPEDDQELTMEELRAKYKSLYNPEDIEEYWKECQPVPKARLIARKTAAAAAAAAPAEPTAAPEEREEAEPVQPATEVAQIQEAATPAELPPAPEQSENLHQQQQQQQTQLPQEKRKTRRF
eukprot:TRINITY_DN3552_c0_g1_i1.p1 TRINITY_DN3552_c0_g1~~TRINITY_DN3552_c0_g1_i1.p1  ORF type:complete len:433 (+),score=108.28 TRINITY_DN3552_c0_g1_i1:41-1300(+)